MDGGYAAKKSKKVKPTAPELGNVTAMEASHFERFEEATDTQSASLGPELRTPLRVCSFNEKRAENIVCTGYSPEWRVHNGIMLSRVYPCAAPDANHLSRTRPITVCDRRAKSASLPSSAD